MQPQPLLILLRALTLRARAIGRRDYVASCTALHPSKPLQALLIQFRLLLLPLRPPCMSVCLRVGVGMGVAAAETAREARLRQSNNGLPGTD